MSLFCAAFFIAFMAGVAPSHAQNTLKQEAQYKAWRVFTTGSGATKSCYIVSEPVRKKPTNVRRGEIFIAITHRPAQNVFNEVSLRIGYPFAKTSQPSARIGGTHFSFFTGAALGESSAAWAWVEDTSQHNALIEAAKRGTVMEFKGTSRRGTLTTDQYSLLGFTAAHQHLNRICAPS